MDAAYRMDEKSRERRKWELQCLDLSTKECAYWLISSGFKRKGAAMKRREMSYSDYGITEEQAKALKEQCKR